MCVTLLHLVISQGVYRTDFYSRNPLTHSLWKLCPKSPLKLVELFFGHFSGYMSQNVVYRSSTSQSCSRRKISPSEVRTSESKISGLLFVFSPKLGCRVLVWLNFGGISFGKAFRIFVVGGRKYRWVRSRGGFPWEISGQRHMIFCLFLRLPWLNFPHSGMVWKSLDC